MDKPKSCLDCYQMRGPYQQYTCRRGLIQREGRNVIIKGDCSMTQKAVNCPYFQDMRD